MFLVTILHTEGHGGILFSGLLSYTKENFFYSNYSIAWLLEISAYCAVNCYALITGYFNWNRNIQYSKLVLFWLQVVFYMITITLIFSLIKGNNSELWFNALFPIMTYQYWYMTAYVGVFLFMPILNTYIQNTKKQILILHLLALFLIASVLPLFFSRNGDPFIFNNGYSTLWLVLMYLSGGIIHKCNIGKTFSKKRAFAGYLSMILITWAYKMIAEYLNFGTNAKLINLISYRSPTIILSGIFLLFLFSRINITRSFLAKPIVLLSNATLGVYLIHEMPLIRANYISGYAKEFATLPVLEMVGHILLGALSIYCICTLIELGRIYLFKMLKIADILKKCKYMLKNALNR